MVTVERGLVLGAAVLATTLALLDATAGLTATAWLTGLGCGAVVAIPLARSRVDSLGPADLVTLTRLALSCAVAAVAVDAAIGHTRPTVLLGLAAATLALDAVDGRVARLTGTGSEFGGRFDGEVDAFLLLVLSAYVAATGPAWVIAIGAARYVFWLAGLAWPWLRDRLPFRWWRKVVTAGQGIVLLVAVADVLPRWATDAALLVALALLAESFGRDVVWLWRRRRSVYDQALEPARRAAYPPGEFVGQESFVRASEVLALARRAGVGQGVRVLDLCCGVAGPGRLVTELLGCSYVGVDASAAAIRIARRRTAGLPCTFQVSRIPPLPEGRYDVVLLLETMLAFPVKQPLLQGIAAALRPGGRFVFTVEEGRPLTADEAEAMPAADTVWPTTVPELATSLGRAGLRITSMEDCTGAHLEVVEALLEAYAADRPAIEDRIGRQVLDDLLASHRLWSDWLGSGRIRKFACVAEKPLVDGEPAGPPTRTATWESVLGPGAVTSSDRSER